MNYIEILENAKWKSTVRNNHAYIEAVYNGLEVSIRDDSTNLIVKRNGKVWKRVDVGGTAEYEALFPAFYA
jgi:hypothetical protein